MGLDHTRTAELFADKCVCISARNETNGPAYGDHPRQVEAPVADLNSARTDADRAHQPGEWQVQAAGGQHESQRQSDRISAEYSNDVSSSQPQVEGGRKAAEPFRGTVWAADQLSKER
jgi:hypothetical protein